METNQMIETIEKGIVKGEKKEVDDIQPKEEKMEVDSESAVDEEKKGIKPLRLKIEPEREDLGKLGIEGIDSGDDDDDEEFVIMTPDEIRAFMIQKFSEHVEDPEVNPLLGYRKHAQELLDEIQYKTDDLSKLGKALDLINRNQEKFLRHLNVFPKLITNNVSVSVDLPLLQDSVPLGSTYKAKDEDAVIKKDLHDAKIMSPSVPKTAPTPVTPAVPSAISITPIVPNTSTTATAVPSTSATASAAPKTPTSNLTTTVKSLPKVPSKPADDIECIDLTDDAPATNVKPATNSSPLAAISLVKHPAPLPPRPFSSPNSVRPNYPPKPRLKVSTEERGIVLQWDMPPNYNPTTVSAYSKLKAFDIFGYQELKNMVINTLLWKKIGSVKAMSLPMACTLTQFVEGQKYHFAIRAVDIYDRCGAYSDPISVVYKPV